jgi:nitrogen fixation protein FixH
MKLSMNWGTWIVISFIVFAAGTFAMVYISMSTKVDLVTDDYYEKELRYQEHIDLVKGTNSLDGQVALELSNSIVRLSFPNIGTRESYSGSIQFFRPSDKSSDFILPVAVDSSYGQSVPAALFSKGLWRVKISWVVGKQHYYSELPLMVQ